MNTSLNDMMEIFELSGAWKDLDRAAFERKVTLFYEFLSRAEDPKLAPDAADKG